MKYVIALLITATLLPDLCLAQRTIQVKVPTWEEEVDYIWRNIQDIPFFERNHYHVAFPELRIVDELKTKARNKSLDDMDYKKFKKQFQDSVYVYSDYNEGVRLVSGALNKVETMVSEIGQLDLHWQFKLHTDYTVNLTLYGPGGSYNPDTGEITLFTTPTGQFKQYADPACAIIHEIVHMGIEESLIQKYQVPHTMKERMVDRFVLINFEDMLPDYRVQQMGDDRIDDYMQLKEQLGQLDDHVKKLLND